MIFNEIKCRVNTILGLVGGYIPCILPPCVRPWKCPLPPADTYATSGVADGEQMSESAPWQAKCKNRAPT